MIVQRNETFWTRHPGLAWSNPEADDSVRIRAALLRPRFRRLLDIAREFGLPRIQREWKALAGDEDDEAAAVEFSEGGLVLRDFQQAG